MHVVVVVLLRFFVGSRAAVVIVQEFLLVFLGSDRIDHALELVKERLAMLRGAIGSRLLWLDLVRRSFNHIGWW